MRPLVPATLLGLALLLGGAAAYELAAPVTPVTVPTVPPARRTPRAAIVTPYVPPAVESFADLDARPLFSARRKPLVDPGQPNGAAGAASDFSLVGVIMGSERAVALLRVKSTAATMSAMVGGTVNGWRVTRIDATSVTLHANGTEVVVPLEGPADRAPSAPLEPVQAGTPAAATAPPPPAPAPTPALSGGTPTAPPAAASMPVAAATPAKPATHSTIAPEALKGAPRDPKTGEPTL